MAEFRHHMKRWAVLTVLLYAVVLLLLTVPVIWIAFNGWVGKRRQPALRAEDIPALGLLALADRAGRRTDVAAAAARPHRRTPAAPAPAVESAGDRHRAFPGQPLFAGLLSILCLYFQEDGFNFSVTSCRSSPTSVALRFCHRIRRRYHRAGLLDHLGRDLPQLRQIRCPGHLAQPHHALAPARQHPRTPRRRAQPHHRPPPRRLLRARLARSGASSPAFPSCCCASVPGFSFCSSSVANGCNPGTRTRAAPRQVDFPPGLSRDLVGEVDAEKHGDNKIINIPARSPNIK